MFEWLKRKLPWNRPQLADLPEDQWLKAKALMLGAGAGGSGRIEILRTDAEKEGNGETGEATAGKDNVSPEQG